MKDNKKPRDALRCVGHQEGVPLYCCSRFGMVEEDGRKVICKGYVPDLEYLTEVESKDVHSQEEKDLLDARRCTAKNDCFEKNCKGYGIVNNGSIKKCIGYVPDFGKLEKFISKYGGDKDV